MNREEMKEAIEQTLVEHVMELQGEEQTLAVWRRDMFQAVMKVQTAEEMSGAMLGLNFAAAALLAIYARHEGLESCIRYFDRCLRETVVKLLEAQTHEAQG